MNPHNFENNLQTYNNPSDYDSLYAHYQDDLHYIQRYLGTKKDPIIELACGTGRIAIPLAACGIPVFGIDLHEGMIQHGIEKAKKQDVEVQFIVQDCTQLQLPITTKFMYMTGNSFQHFLTNDSQNALLQSVKKHLQPGGEFLFDTRNAILSDLSSIDEYEEQMVTRNGEQRFTFHREEYDPVTQILTCHAVHQQDGKTYEDSILLRYTYPMEMMRLLQQNGFELVHLYGTWQKHEFRAQSPSMIIHVRSR
ncbi:class I SAM-dependent methyltransferase [Lysinibacillus fusiformis]|uniref:class I SAM-dependent methyltransferase n=1 Tax=Lysinibacillus fusiformis TaxID=28031 RepID=UPI001880D616|nr:class I SAM-dependent methyltransferase [Lysinibacillus fusiformis]MBD8521456.1 methyltransferase domain-containing protein [Lysinibacillus fusiformis]